MPPPRRGDPALPSPARREHSWQERAAGRDRCAGCSHPGCCIQHMVSSSTCPAGRLLCVAPLLHCFSSQLPNLRPEPRPELTPSWQQRTPSGRIPAAQLSPGRYCLPCARGSCHPQASAAGFGSGGASGRRQGWSGCRFQPRAGSGTEGGVSDRLMAWRRRHSRSPAVAAIAQFISVHICRACLSCNASSSAAHRAGGPGSCYRSLPRLQLKR